MAGQFYNWSRTAASNATADASVNFAEGQAPSSVNDSARALMASVASYRDDISGAIVTGGSSTAYTVTSYEIFDTLAHMNGQVIAFTPHTANGATVTLNVDGLGAKPLRPSTGVELQSNVLIAGTPYAATYNNSDAAWYLHGLGGNTYGVPLLGGMDYWDTVTPSSAFIFPAGQALSRTAYATTFTRWGTQFGAGDGSTTFNAPDKTGRVSAMIEASSTRLTTITSGNSTILGGTGGLDKITMAQANMPNVTLAVAGSISVTSTTNVANGTRNDAALQGGITHFDVFASGTLGIGAVASTGSAALTSASINGNTTQTAMNNTQPVITCNYIIRVI